MGIHYVFFADDLGIASVYPALKDRLAKPGYTHVSLLYRSADSLYAFQKELEILHRHFPTRLLIYYYSGKPARQWIIEQGDIEAVLNANTMRQMSFIISGNELFTKNIKEVLLFLGIEDVAIQEQYFTE
ncbi:ferredoxin reductase domain-containing protein [Chitinophaga ginsengisoli]|uniref:Oxidoreductase FAD/NAD(P)-binding domain-containing protein n=1 Tax=Chitinophaga ginsengisoli TaxID=363837 RepID=A0A2P8G6X3_9BACT|nr:hypothetical protein [Chitinophaga ginsengisoli]PSL29728.1 hypothetical protein CLV42_10662 [Chitinophaga ginsengisoli]